MARCELTVWLKGNEYGETRFYPTKKKAEIKLRQFRKHKRFRVYTLIVIRKEYYTEWKKKKPYLFKPHKIPKR